MKGYKETRTVTWEKENDGFKTLIETSSLDLYFHIYVSGPCVNSGSNKVQLCAHTLAEAVILAESAINFLKENMPALAVSDENE